MTFLGHSHPIISPFTPQLLSVFVCERGGWVGGCACLCVCLCVFVCVSICVDVLQCFPVYYFQTQQYSKHPVIKRTQIEQAELIASFAFFTLNMPLVQSEPSKPLH